MNRLHLLIAGLVAVALLIVLPLTLTGGSRSADRLIAQLLRIDQHQSLLEVEVLSLRLGRTKNYDGLVHYMNELHVCARLAKEEAAQSDAPEDRVLAARLAEVSKSLEDLDELVMRFPTYNASVANSTLTIEEDLERLLQGTFPIESGDPAALEDLCHRALALQASWSDAKGKAFLEEQREIEGSRASMSREHRTLLRHLELSVEHRLLANQTLNDFLSHSQGIRLQPDIEKYMDRFTVSRAEERRSDLGIQSACFALALLICIALCTSSWKQSRDLSREIDLRQQANEEARAYERQLIKAQKLEAIGNLAAGIAHEINTPTQYVGDNTRFLEESFDEIVPLLRKAVALSESVHEQKDVGNLAQEFLEEAEEADFEFLDEEIPKAIEQSLMGIDRVRKIVQSMKEFSHPGGDEMELIDLNRAIESTVTVAGSEWKYVAEIEKQFDADLPLVPCLPGELNQVVLNIIVNAAHAIGDREDREERGKGLITIETLQEEQHAVIRISDTGHGIPREIQDKIYNPFFTTKEVGRGTGQGLALAHNVIVGKHEGLLELESTLGEGTTFIIRLPLERHESEPKVVPALES